MIHWAQGTNAGVGIGAKGVEVGPGTGLEEGVGVGLGVGVGMCTNIVLGLVGPRRISGRRTSSFSSLFSVVKRHNSSHS